MKSMIITPLVAALAAASLVASAPADEGPELYEPCANSQGLPTVTVDEGVSVDLDTPLGTGIPFLGTLDVQTVDGGDYLVDLASLEVGTFMEVRVDLSWTNGLEDSLTDYDMVVNGMTYQSVNNPETALVFGGHCQIVSVDEVYAYTGVPMDELTLDLELR